MIEGLRGLISTPASGIAPDVCCKSTQTKHVGKWKEHNTGNKIATLKKKVTIHLVCDNAKILLD
jgi:hypothetical protein